MYLDLIVNVSLLIALANIYSLLARRRIVGRRGTQILMGILFGAGAIIGMLIPFQYAPGIFYDGRSIILTIAGLFGGGTTGAVSILIAGAYRAYLGGNGVWAGLATITSCTLVGLAFRRASSNHPEKYSLPMLIAIGAAAHIAMLASQLLVKPWPAGTNIIQQIWLPVMLIFPATTMLIAILLKNEEHRIQIEKDLEISEAHYHDLVESSQALIWQCDMDGRFIYLNPAWEEIFGYKTTEMVGKKLTDFQPPEYAERDSREFSRVLQGHPFKELETMYLGKDGREIYLISTVNLLTDEAGHPTGSRGTAYDITARKRAQTNLEASINREKELADIVREAPIAIAFGYPDGRLENCNEAFSQLTGYSIAELQQIDWNEILTSPKWQTIEKEKLRELSASQNIVQYEKEYLRKDGTPVPVELTVTAKFDSAGKIVHYIGFVSDITERKRADTALHDLASRQEALLAAIPEIIMETDMNKMYTWANQPGIEFFGEDVLGKEAADYFEGEQKTYEIVQPLFNGRENLTYLESWQRRKDGQKRLLAWWCHVLKDREGQVIGALSSARDITEQHLAQKELSQSRHQLESIFRVAPTGIGVVIDRKFQYVNHRFLEMLGYSEEELIGQLSRMVYPSDEEFERVGKDKYEEIKISGTGTIETVMQKKDGGLIDVLLSSTPLDLEDLSQGVTFTALDITQRKQAEEQLRQLNIELENRVKERTAELEAFAYSVSHDLKAPLRGIDGYSHLLLEDYADKLDEEGRFFLHTIRQATQQMKQLIEDLLEYSRMQRRALSIKTIDVTQLVEALLSERAAEISAQNITVAVAVPAMNVNAEVEGLAQALRNLLDNAIKFSRGVPEPRIEIGGRVEEKTCILWVRDNGVGFDPRYKDRIFEIFQRLHNAEEYPGTGIGLAIVRQAMKRMNGSVWSESKSGEGAAFYLEMPKAQATSA